ncbi:MAG: hypothetical protein JZU64_09840 [Rhodoferax sp.]|nr:hypothetical protein [Rhodoferax sp.]
MKALLGTTLAIVFIAIAAPATAQVTFYTHEGFEGRSFTTTKAIGNFERQGLNDRAASAKVVREHWLVCEDAYFNGRCTVLRPGKKYESLATMGLKERISSAQTVTRDKPIADNSSAPNAPYRRNRAAQIIFYERDEFRGRDFTMDDWAKDLSRLNMINQASSLVILSDRWTVCEDTHFSTCVVLRPGRYASPTAMGLNRPVLSAKIANDNSYSDADPIVKPPSGAANANAAQITLYIHESFEGRSFTTEDDLSDFDSVSFSDGGASIVVIHDRWEVCEGAHFKGRCVVLRPGSYSSLTSMGLSNHVSSVRTARGNEREGDKKSASGSTALNAYHPRSNEALYEVNVISTRAVLGTPEHRCWIEHEPVAQERNNANVPAALAGAVISGILGHQVGGEQSKDIATAVGAFGGAAVGAAIGRDGDKPQKQTQDIQHCTSIPNQAKPDYWDVTYIFRGQEHRIQMTTPPRATVTVNEEGEPRQ